jgi:putative heme-binding domain-containing protein
MKKSYQLTISAILFFLIAHTTVGQAVSPDFRLTNIQMSDGRVLSGLVRPRDQQSLTLITANQTITLAKTDIEAQRATDQSIMPEGQLEAMNVKERTALLRYLMTESPPVDGR